MVRLFVLVAGLLLLAAGTLFGVARVTSHPIDGIGCDFSEASNYHVHAHLTLVRHGEISHPPANVGFRAEHLCLYWLHTHDNSGTIHIEAPHHVAPTVRNFFDIWGRALTRREIGTYRLVSRDKVRVYVNGRSVLSDPGLIVLRKHTSVTIEIGPEFIPPPKPDFKGL
jgi:hypothetical protein